MTVTHNEHERVSQLVEQLHALKTARQEEQRLHQEMTWAAGAIAEAILLGNPAKETLIALARSLNEKLDEYYRARDRVNETERGYEQPKEHEE